jgi:hypothetical protein
MPPIGLDAAGPLWADALGRPSLTRFQASGELRKRPDPPSSA